MQFGTSRPSFLLTWLSVGAGVVLVMEEGVEPKAAPVGQL